MKIFDLQIQGFRSLYNISWKPGNLNVIIGLNGNGKSNLLKALEMLSQSAMGKLSQQILREGGMDSLAWDEQNAAVQFKLVITPPENLNDGKRNNITYQLNLNQLGSSSSYKIGYELLGDHAQFNRRFKPHQMIILERYLSSATIYDDQRRGLLIPQESMVTEESLLSCEFMPFATNNSISLVQNWLSHWQIYHDFQTHRDAAVRQEVPARMESELDFDGSNLVQVLHGLYNTHPDFKMKVNSAMKAAFGDDFDGLSFQPAANQQVALLINWKSSRRSQSSAVLSDGTLRFLYLITILANPTPPVLIAIDEPITGLHPSMVPIIAELARNASRRAQIIITTHSEDFLDAISEYDPTVTIADMDDGKTRLNVLDGESLRYWMKESAFRCINRSSEAEGIA